MANLHYYVDPKTYVEMTDKFIGIINTFIDLMNASSICKDMNKSISNDIGIIKSSLASNKKIICTGNGYTRYVTGGVEYLTMTLASTTVTVISNKFTSKDDNFSSISGEFIKNFGVSLKTYGLDVLTQIIRVDIDKYHSTIKMNDLMSIDVTIHIPSATPTEEVITEDYYTNLWIEFNLDLGNDYII